MKKPTLFAASVAAASAISASSSTNSTYTINSTSHLSLQEPERSKEHRTTGSSDKFAPRFDGLKFIETLVTAHR